MAPPTTEARYVLEHGPAGPRILDTERDVFAPCTDDRITRDVTAALNAGKTPYVLWVDPSYMADLDDLARITAAHGNG